ncbi:dTDP-4-amino-4,6-dideoxygalactose transaminase [Gracilibacillus orientalis]|uniref:dTDP-4-amino-4,6-dideoxygalactose transaminase n=1 Tax=Gracilibacillus orientalis TaxID=334253 RepID=A0A1I4PDR1_9BACI|nr:DegT/DnrJ/EryC1/StrS family aminotransferase [Gracilibacillus orientalis]SFM25797.1 dTDP-4-amino-4,6-dideoxygalactose transaminase [Gracilibacillus orientalis]
MGINVTRSSMPPLEDYINEISDLWNSRWLTNGGMKYQEFETQLTEYLMVSKASLFSNGHLALETVLQAFNLSGEVITTPFTFASTTHAIVRNKLTPIFCDIDPFDFTMDVTKIENLITEKTTAIVPVHVYGNICDMNKIQKIADKYNLKVIYDAAHTFGMKVNGRGIGDFGDASMFSFHATKVFNSIEGGVVTYKKSQIKESLDAIKNFGISGEDEVEYIGTNAKMNEFQAAMGLCNLKYINEEIRKRKIVYERYKERLSHIKGIRIRVDQPNVENNYAYFPIILDDYIYHRDELLAKLKQNNIIARKYFYPLTSNFECYKGLFKNSITPIAEQIANNVLTLPLYSDLSLNDVDHICDLIIE